MNTPIEYIARLTCRDCRCTGELPARAVIDGGCSYMSGQSCKAELDCDTYSADWHDCGAFVLCGSCWRGETQR